MWVYSIGEQNKETTKGRQHRNVNDTYSLLHALADRKPFEISHTQMNIMNGLHASSAVHVDNAKASRNRPISRSVLIQVNGQVITLHSR